MSDYFIAFTIGIHCGCMFVLMITLLKIAGSL
jgi:hypothetical protein